MKRPETLTILDYSVLTDTLDKLTIGGQCVVNTLNQYSYMVAEKDQTFKRALLQSDILLPDGIGIVAAARILKGENIRKIAGSDIHIYLLGELNKNGGSCFYLGSSAETLAGIEQRLQKDFPAIRAGFYSPPFKHQFSDAENKEMIDAVNAFSPDVLFVGMTAPKQEKWVYIHREKLNARIICSIGAVFDFYSGTIKRPGQFWINLGLEWLVRLVNEPNHLWKRYLVYGPRFINVVLKEKLFSVFGKEQK